MILIPKLSETVRKINHRQNCHYINIHWQLPWTNACSELKCYFFQVYQLLPSPSFNILHFIIHTVFHPIIHIPPYNQIIPSWRCNNDSMTAIPNLQILTHSRDIWLDVMCSCVLRTQKFKHFAQQFVQCNAAAVLYSKPELFREDLLVC